MYKHGDLNYLVKDIELMEKVQKRMTRMLPDLKNMSYPERLKKLGEHWNLVD